MALVSWDAGRKKTLTIPDGQQSSDTLDMGSIGHRGSYRLGILSPAALTGIVTIEVSDLAAGPFRTLQSDNVDVTLATGKAAVLDPFPFPYVRIVSSLAEAADRGIILIAVMA